MDNGERNRNIDWVELNNEVRNTLLSFKFSRRALLFVLFIFLVFPVSKLFLHTEVFIIPPKTLVFCIVYVGFILISVYIFFLLFKKKYRLSYWEYLSSIFILLVYSFIRWQDSIHLINEPKWRFAEFGEYFTYFDPPALLIVIYVIRALFRTFNDFLNGFRENKYKSTFIEDNPVSAKELKEDNTYNHLISKIAPALFKDIYKSSFSIGVIGPWGTGKSSFLKAVEYTVCKASEKELKENYDVDHKPDTIFIEFSPFLNHNEKQVIHEFFTQLSNELSERSGRLSNLITVYSEKLANLKGKNPWFSLFKLARNSREIRSAQELYDQIEACIRELDIKIIVAVDDLDRLNAQEILQVLKLIRNTSNFPNMVFLVAMDKEYVMKTLGKQNNYSYREYIDKFFQIELNLREPEYNDLISYFIKLIDRAKILDEKNMTELQKALQSEENLSLNQIFSNYRASIKIINQILIDYDRIPDLFIEINPGDYLKFLFIKSSFPSFYKRLVADPEKYFSKSNGYFTLKEKESTKTEKESITDQKMIDAFIKANKGKFNLNFEHYAFGEELENTHSEIIFTTYEADLVKLIFSEIFNSTSVNPNSVHKVSNFYKLMRFQLDENEINEIDFKDIVLKTEEAQDSHHFNKIIDEFELHDKSNKLVKRLESFIVQDRSIHLNFVKLHFSLLSRHQIFNNDKTFHLLLSSLERFLEIKTDKSSEDETFRFFRDIQVSKTELKQILKEFWIDNEDVSNIKRFDLILSFKENRLIESLWNKSEFEELAVELFRKYLSDYTVSDWKVDDFQFFSYLRSLAECVDHGRVQEVVKKHFKNSPFETFCRQIIHSDFQATKHLYGISDLIPVMFKSYEEFYSYIEPKISDKYRDSTNFKKFLHLLKHFIIINDKSNPETTYYIAEKFEGWLDKEEEKLNRGGNVTQLIIHIYSDKLFQYLNTNSDWATMLNSYRIRQVLKQSVKFDGKYLFLTYGSINQVDIQGLKNEWFMAVKTCAHLGSDDELNIFNLKMIEDTDGKKVYKTISIEPSIN